MAHRTPPAVPATDDPAPDAPPTATDPFAAVVHAYSPEAERQAIAKYEAWRAERRARGRDLMQQARRGWAAVQGWDRLETQEQWEALKNQMVEDWESGTALLQMLGGMRYVEPERAALCLTLWQDFLVSYRPTGPAEYLVIAMAVLSFDHFLRINGLVQSLQVRLEDEFFNLQPLTATTARNAYDRLPNGLTVSQVAEQIGLDALPWLDRLNRLVIRNLRTLRELKGGALSLTVANYGQLNVGQQQTNQLAKAPARRETQPRRTRARRRPASGADAEG